MKIIKGNQAITITAIAVLAFVFALVGFFYGVLALLAYAIFIEKDNYLIKQVLTALWLNLVLLIFNKVIDYIFTTFIGNFYNQGNYTGGALLSGISNTGYTLISVVIIVFAIVAITNILKGKDSGVPLFSDLSDWAMGVEKPKPVYNYPPQNTIPNDENNWICPVCKRENNLNFCATCGKERQKK